MVFLDPTLADEGGDQRSELLRVMLEEAIENPKVRVEFGATIEKIGQSADKRQVVTIKRKGEEEESTRTWEADLVSQDFFILIPSCPSCPV